MKYIEENAAIAKICGAKCGVHHYECSGDHNCETVDLLKSVPAADVVRVVRCKDCMYFDKGENASESWEWCTMIGRGTGPNGYCHLGDRKEI